MAGEPRARTPSWLALARLKGNLLREFRTSGVDHVEWVIAFDEPFDFWVWLGTATDAERDSLLDEPDVDDRIRRHAEELGLAQPFEGTTVESKETVDREYQGSWFNRLR